MVNVPYTLLCTHAYYRLRRGAETYSVEHIGLSPTSRRRGATLLLFDMHLKANHEELRKTRWRATFFSGRSGSTDEIPALSSRLSVAHLLLFYLNAMRIC